MIFLRSWIVAPLFACYFFDVNAEQLKVLCTSPLYNPATSEGTLLLVELHSDLFVAAQLILLYLYV